MKMNEMYESFSADNLERTKAIFASIFVMQNRIQTACEKLQTQISMKQWLLIAMTVSCPEPRTLSSVGSLMGCSRQNIKKLAAALENKGFVQLLQGANNSVRIELTEKAAQYFAEMEQRHSKTMQLLFSHFSEEEIMQLFRLYGKLYEGIEKVEKYAQEI